MKTQQEIEKEIKNLDEIFKTMERVRTEFDNIKLAELKVLLQQNKEFIRLLKEAITHEDGSPCLMVKEIIDKLAGSKLTEEKTNA